MRVVDLAEEPDDRGEVALGEDLARAAGKVSGDLAVEQRALDDDPGLGLLHALAQHLEAGRRDGAVGAGLEQVRPRRSEPPAFALGIAPVEHVRSCLACVSSPARGRRRRARSPEAPRSISRSVSRRNSVGNRFRRQVRAGTAAAGRDTSCRMRSSRRRAFASSLRNTFAWYIDGHAADLLARGVEVVLDEPRTSGQQLLAEVRYALRSAWGRAGVPSIALPSMPRRLRSSRSFSPNGFQSARLAGSLYCGSCSRSVLPVAGSNAVTTGPEVQLRVLRARSSASSGHEAASSC